MRIPKQKVEVLPEKKTPRKKKENLVKPVVHNVFILDCSGSMYPKKYEVALRGINDEQKELSVNPDVTFTHTLVEFGSRDHIYFTRFMSDDSSPIKERRELGMTALNDAIIQTLHKILNFKKQEEKILVKIFTDGGENNSVNSGQSGANIVKNLIHECEKNGFTITFVGTEYDVSYSIKAFGINKSNTLVHDNTPDSIEKYNLTRGVATKIFSKAVADGEDVSTGFYSKVVND